MVPHLRVSASFPNAAQEEPVSVAPSGCPATVHALHLNALHFSAPIGTPGPDPVTVSLTGLSPCAQWLPTTAAPRAGPLPYPRAGSEAAESSAG